ncbi:hypothetical protein R5R35_001123 [Gryllus longicercus]|uniref:Uncharacterized protein n=1 Tax=Gryllus longicercus TaxID=2509291 RepID=A0AAN9W1D1_9ORTH
MSNDWNSLNVKEKIMLVTTDILQLLDSICEKTKPGGELDSVIEIASESFDPLGELLQINLEEEDDKSINIKTLSQHILSGHSIITPEVERLLGTSFKPAARNVEESESNKSLSTSSQSGQIIQNSKRIDELLASRNYKRHRDLVVEKESSKHSPAKDLTQPGPSGLQTRRKDTSVQERLLNQNFRSLGPPRSSATFSEHTSERRKPEHSENLSQPGPSGITAFFKPVARSSGKNEGNQSLSRRSQNEHLNYDVSKRIQLKTRRKDASVRETFTKHSFSGQPQPTGTSQEIIEDREESWLRQHSEVSSPKRALRSVEKSEGNERIETRSQSEQVKYDSSKGDELHASLGLKDIHTKRKDAPDREKFPQKILRSASQQGPSKTSTIATSEERQSRHSSEESSQSGRGKRSKGIGKGILPPRLSSVDQSEINQSISKKKSSDSKQTRESSIYKSYTHYSPDDWETESDESEKDNRRSSTIY